MGRVGGGRFHGVKSPPPRGPQDLAGLPWDCSLVCLPVWSGVVGAPLSRGTEGGGAGRMKGLTVSLVDFGRRAVSPAPRGPGVCVCVCVCVLCVCV